MAIPLPPSASALGTTVAEVKVYGARLDRSQLNRLIRACTDGVTPSAAEITTVWNGARLRADSLSGLQTAVENRLEPGEWRRLDNLRICSVGDTRSVVCDIGSQTATVTIESTDGDWAIGRGEQFRKILRYAHGSSAPRRWCSTRLSMVGLAIGGTIVALLTAARIVDGDPGSVVMAALIVVVPAIIGFLAGSLRGRRNQTVLWLDDSIPKRGWAAWTFTQWVALFTLLIALCSLIVTITK